MQSPARLGLRGSLLRAGVGTYPGRLPPSNKNMPHMRVSHTADDVVDVAVLFSLGLSALMVISSEPL